MEINRAALEMQVVALMNDGNRPGNIQEATILEGKAKREYNPQNGAGDPRESLLNSIRAAKMLARLAHADTLRIAEREALVIRTERMYGLARDIARYVELDKAAELIYKEFDETRIELKRLVKKQRIDGVYKNVLSKRIQMRHG